MSTERNPEEGTRSGFMVAVLAWVGGGLALYVLSVGPISVIYSSNSRAPAIVDAFYKPLELLYNQGGPVRAFYDWYLPLWRGE